MLKKSHVLQAVLDALEAEFRNFAAISKKTRSTGNDAQTKSEGKYDTRSTEENYLADGQAKQAHAARVALVAISKLPLESFADETPIHLGALVQVGFATESLWFFLAPAAGGLEVVVDGIEVTVITLDSPLGSQLKGRQKGDSLERPAAKILEVL